MYAEAVGHNSQTVWGKFTFTKSSLRGMTSIDCIKDNVFTQVSTSTVKIGLVFAPSS